MQCDKLAFYNMPLVNKKVLGKFKDELNDKIMEEFICLRSKLYAYKISESEKQTKKATGIKKILFKKKHVLRISESVC